MTDSKMIDKEIPQYEHDCSGCIFLGRHHDELGHPVDLYACVRNNLIDTVIARRSSDPHDYCSGILFATRRIIPELVEALHRAKKLGMKERYSE